jgi:hypothetical protein
LASWITIDFAVKTPEFLYITQKSEQLVTRREGLFCVLPAEVSCSSKQPSFHSYIHIDINFGLPVFVSELRTTLKRWLKERRTDFCGHRTQRLVLRCVKYTQFSLQREYLKHTTYTEDLASQFKIYRMPRKCESNRRTLLVGKIYEKNKEGQVVANDVLPISNVGIFLLRTRC